MEKNSKIKIFSILAAIVLLLIFLSLFFQREKFRDAIFDVAYIPQKTFFFIGDTFLNGFKIVFSLKDIIEENAVLRSKNEDLTKKNIELENLKKENKLLRNQLSLSEKNSFNLLDVKIVSFEPSNFSEFVVINKGSKDGIKKDMPVILPGNILIGKVFKAYENYSNVLLITDKNNKVNVKSFVKKDGQESEKTSYTGVLNGYFGKSLFMNLIEKKSDIKKGDLIITSGLDGVYPDNLIIGTVDIIKDDDNAVFKQAYLNPAFLPLNFTLAFVIR